MAVSNPQSKVPNDKKLSLWCRSIHKQPAAVPKHPQIAAAYENAKGILQRECCPYLKIYLYFIKNYHISSQRSTPQQLMGLKNSANLQLCLAISFRSHHCDYWVVKQYQLRLESNTLHLALQLLKLFVLACLFRVSCPATTEPGYQLVPAARPMSYKLL